MGAKLHPWPAEEVDTSWQSDLADLKSFAKLLLVLWTQWPKLTKVEPRPGPSNTGLPRKRKPRGNSNPGATQHCWNFGCGRWQCSACLLTSYSTRSRNRLSKVPCPAGGKPVLKVLAGSNQGHNKIVAICDGFPLVFCTTCGKWGTKKIIHIFRPCSGAQTPAGTAALKKLAGSVHPKPPYSLIVGPAGRLLEDGTVEEAVMSKSQIKLAALKARVAAKHRG
eukprot:4909055-Heterocapsa_arctica.AAC.1